MSLDVITAGGDIEVIIFWSIGAFVLGVGVLDTIFTPKDKDYEE